jgi:hypothetical protein
MSRSVTPARRTVGALAAALLAAAAPARAQDAATVARPDGSRAGACESRDEGDNWWSGRRRGHACERRTLALRPRALVRLDAGPNGGATVRAADTARAPLVVAVVTARARTDAEAARLAAQVRLVDGPDGTLRAEGPRRDADGDDDDRSSWSVSWRVTVPRRTDLDVRAVNGGVRVAGVVGRLRLESNNGGMRLDSVGGAVEAHTNNGGAVATLVGRAWEGAGLADAGLDLHSNNGGATLRVPDGYSARVSVGTNNGGLAVEFPITVQGRVDPRRLELTLGAGGAPVRVTTNNGGARIGRAP